MKNPLRYQITEFDCGSVSLVNCIAFLFEREEIPAELIKNISSYTLDCYDAHGNLGQKGTSRDAVKYLSRWICNFAASKDFGLKLSYLTGKDVTLDAIRDCIKNNGSVNFRTYESGEHYVTITNIDFEYVYIFDPYFVDKNFYSSDVELDFNHPFQYNRKVKLNRLLSETKSSFAMGPINKREILLFYRTNKK